MRRVWGRVQGAIRLWWQRRTRGWDDSDLWSLDHTHAKWIAPRLRRFKQVTYALPSSLLYPDGTGESIGTEAAAATWNKVLDDMIYAFEFVADEDRFFGTDPNHPDWARVAHGLELFARYYNCLWY